MTRAAQHHRQPLSPAQRALWTVCQLRSDRGEYNIAVAYELRGAVDVLALRGAVDDLSCRHPVLSARFVEAPAVAMDLIPGGTVPFTVHGRHMHGRHPHAGTAAPDRVTRAAALPFDLGTGPLARVDLFPAGDARSFLLLTVHHLVADARSFTVLWADLAAFYSARVAGAVAHAPLPDSSFASYLSQQRPVPEPELRRHLRYWRQVLHGASSDSLLPSDFRVEPGQPRQAGIHRFAFGSDLAGSLRGLARQTRATEFAASFTSLAVTAARFRDTPDVLIATPVTDRSVSGFDRSVGYFVAMAPLRLRIEPEQGFAYAVQRTRDALLGALMHRDVPFDRLVEACAPGRDPRDNPLAPGAFQLLNAEELPAFAGLSLRRVALNTGTSRFDLECSLLALSDGSYAGELVFDRGRYDAATVASFALAWGRVLRQVTAEPERPVGALWLLDETAEPAVRLTGQGEVRTIDQRPLPHRIAAHAAEIPDAAAIVADGQTLTYGTLDRLAGGWAARLMAAGARPGDVVGVSMPRSAGMIVAMLAVLRLGAAYLPLDPDHPIGRRTGILHDAGARHLLVTAADADWGSGETGPAIVVVPDGPDLTPNPDTDRFTLGSARPTPDDVAYVIYTSGSTGSPKGVAVVHRSLCNLLDWFADRHALGPGRRCAQLSAPAFDAHILDVWATLASGATVHIAPDAVRADWPALSGWLATHRIDVTYLPIALAAEAIGREREAHRTTLVTGGDVLGSFPQGSFQVRYMYGPTEATVVVTEDTVDLRLPQSVRPTVGRPLWNTEILIVDGDGRCVPRGAVGEIWIGGASVAHGYLGRPELSAASFVTTGDGQRFYRTGDRGRWCADGRLEFLGRQDRQVKIRGSRVEPAEVEAALATHDGVREAAVFPDTDGSALFALVVPAAGCPPPPRRELRAHLRGRLPEYMIPVSFAAVDRLPRTPSGKLARDALDPAAFPDIATEPDGGPAASVVSPRTAVEAELVAIWSDELRVAPVSVDDTLFDLGANSLSVVHLASRLRKHGHPVAASDLLRHPTVAALAAILDGGEPADGGNLTDRRRE